MARLVLRRACQTDQGAAHDLPGSVLPGATSAALLVKYFTTFRSSRLVSESPVCGHGRGAHVRARGPRISHMLRSTFSASYELNDLQVSTPVERFVEKTLRSLRFSKATARRSAGAVSDSDALAFDRCGCVDPSSRRTRERTPTQGRALPAVGGPVGRLGSQV